MKFGLKRIAAWTLTLAVLAVVVPAARAIADEYVLGPEDVISISVYLHPDLDRTTAITVDGTITYPPAGGIKAAGLTTVAP